MNRLDADALSWTGLLAHWLDFARAAKAWPDDRQGTAWRDCVPAVINLQAVTFALAELDRVPPVDRAFASDRAAVLIHENAEAIDSAWTNRLVPESLLEIIDAARLALARSVWVGTQELVWEGPGTFVMPAVPVDAPGGSLAVMQPGTLAMPGEPVAWWHERDAMPVVAVLSKCVRGAVAVPRQVYRGIAPDGTIDGDTVVSFDDDPRPGLPLLVPIWAHGERIGRFTVNAAAWEQQQRAALPTGAVPVEHLE